MKINKIKIKESGKSTVVNTRVFKLTASVIIFLSVFAALYFIGVPRLRLVGVHNDSFAVIENTTNGTQEVFDVGSNIFSNATLIKVESDHVVVMANGKEISLPLKASISAGDAVKQLEQNGMNVEVINRFNVSERLHYLPFQMLSAKTVPVVRDQHIVGVQIVEFPTDSDLAGLGLKPGDIIQSVNGEAVQGIIDALDGIRRSESESVSIELERDGQKTSISIS
jgi:type II secretory pathway component PulC